MVVKLKDFQKLKLIIFLIFFMKTKQKNKNNKKHTKKLDDPSN